jgi:Rrf2 family transcriptional regulator, iron-sulfur cluster assembly transcription factor
MLLSRSCEYGLRASLYLVSRDDKGYVPIREISDALNISFHFLTKILQTLTHQGILASFRGPNGGVCLARQATDIKLIDIVLAIDGPAIFTECILGLPECGNWAPCPLHHGWGQAREQLQVMFSQTTLDELGHRIENERLRLSDIGVGKVRS